MNGQWRRNIMLLSTSILDMSLALGTAAAQDSPRDAIELYFQAHAFGDGDYIRRAFADDAKIEFVENGQLRQWTREEFAQRFHGPAPDEYRRVRRVESLDVRGTAASAVVTLDYPQVLFRDHLSLLKIGDHWKIVHKVFSAERTETAQEALDQVLKDWSVSVEPRRIVGNIYYVGSNLISSFLIVTSAGHILLDTGHVQMLPQVKANIEKLGFKAMDVKILLNTQAHIDHCGGFAEFKRQTGATVIASELAAEQMMQGGKGDYANTGAFANGDDLGYEPFRPDRIIADGERIQLGGVNLTAILTPGHTKGCTSWSMQANENGKEYDVLFLCGLTVSPYKLTNNEKYPNIAQDAHSSLVRLRMVHADVMLAPHGFWFDFEAKAAHQKPGEPNPFIDPDELGRHLAEMEQDLARALQAQERQR
jgi:metallo-beta-lactamase class B